MWVRYSGPYHIITWKANVNLVYTYAKFMPLFIVRLTLSLSQTNFYIKSKQMHSLLHKTNTFDIDACKNKFIEKVQIAY